MSSLKTFTTHKCYTLWRKHRKFAHLRLIRSLIMHKSSHGFKLQLRFFSSKATLWIFTLSKHQEVKSRRREKYNLIIFLYWNWNKTRPKTLFSTRSVSWIWRKVPWLTSLTTYKTINMIWIAKTMMLKKIVSLDSFAPYFTTYRVKCCNKI